MKKPLSICLTILLVAGLLACGSNGGGSTTVAPVPDLRVGYGRVCITPKNKVALSSTNQPTYDGVWDDVYMTCIALTDAQDNTLLMFTTDISYCDAKLKNSLIQLASETTGVSEDYISFSVTHNHSGLDPSGTVTTLLKNSIKECAAQAMDDRCAATLEAGTCYPEGFNFVRHYTTDDGHWVGDNYYSPTGSTAAAYERDADNAMQLMHFVRVGKQNVLLVNWQAHGVYSYLQEYLCADFIGPLRETVEAETGCLMAYFQGAAGNLNPWSNLGDNVAEKTLQGMDQYGQALARYPIEAMTSLTVVNASGISIVNATYTAPVRKDTAEYMEAGASYELTIAAGGTKAEAVAASGDQVHSAYAVEYITNRSRKAPSVDLNIRAVRLGDVAFIVVPYEMFDDNGIFIKENSPFDMTFILGYTNGRGGYIPSAPCIEHGCYGWECGYFLPGTAEALANEYVSLLNSLVQ